MLGCNGFVPGIEDHETAGPISTFDSARFKTALTKGGCLLVTGHAKDRDFAAKQIGVNHAKISGTIAHIRQHIARHAEDVTQIIIPVIFADVKQVGPCGIRGIGCVRLAAGQAPQKETIDRPKRQIALIGPRTRARHMIQNPRHLGRGKIRINQKTRTRIDILFQRRIGFFQIMTQRGCAAVLPDNRVIDRLTGFAIPNHGRFTLVGDADCRHLLDIHPTKGLFADGNHGFPQIFRVMFDPAIIGEMLWEFLLCDGNGTAIFIKDNCP